MTVRHIPQTSQKYLSLDPLFAAVGQTARTWHELTGRPISITHDETSLLTEQRIESLKAGLGAAAVASLGIPPVPLVGVTLVSSEADARIQVADLLAGAARTIADDALRGIEHAAIEDVRQYLDALSLWGDASAWSMLTGKPLESKS